MGVDRIQMRLADKGGHQHQQGRFWQVEIGHKPIRDLKLKPRINENIRIALERTKGATAGGRLNQTQRSRADGNNPTARRPGLLYLSHSLRTHMAPFGMHFMPADLFDLDR